MVILVRLIGILMICMGIINLINPSVMKKMISFWQQGKRIYAGGVIRVVSGAIFFWSSSQAKHPSVIALLGALMILGGMMIFILGPERMKIMLVWWDKKPSFVLRLIAILLLAIGGLVVYSA